MVKDQSSLRKSQRTALRIRQAALQLARVRPVDDITVDDIAAAAGVSRRTYFNHYSSKHDSLLPMPVALTDDDIVAFQGTTGSLMSAITALLYNRAPTVSTAYFEYSKLWHENTEYNRHIHQIIQLRRQTLESELYPLLSERLGTHATPETIEVAAAFIASVEIAALRAWRPSTYEKALEEYTACVDRIIDQYRTLMV